MCFCIEISHIFYSNVIKSRGGVHKCGVEKLAVSSERLQIAHLLLNCKWGVTNWRQHTDRRINRQTEIRTDRHLFNSNSTMRHEPLFQLFLVSQEANTTPLSEFIIILNNCVATPFTDIHLYVAGCRQQPTRSQWHFHRVCLLLSFPSSTWKCLTFTEHGTFLLFYSCRQWNCNEILAKIETFYLS